MRSAGSRLLILALLVMGSLASAQALAAEDVPLALEGIKAQLAELDQQQKQILANQQETFERLDQLRIWVHRK